MNTGYGSVLVAESGGEGLIDLGHTAHQPATTPRKKGESGGGGEKGELSSCSMRSVMARRLTTCGALPVIGSPQKASSPGATFGASCFSGRPAFVYTYYRLRRV